MRLTPTEPEIPEVGGFTDANDIFGYRDFADRLANLVGNINEPLVICLDGPWGSGKSVFAKQWAGMLRERGAQVVHFDAFGNDHYEDAFLAISAEIHGVAKQVLGGNVSATRGFLNKAKKAGKVLAPMAVRVAARAGTAGILNLEDVEASSEAIKEAAKAISNEGAKAVEKVVSEKLRKATEERLALEAFSEALSTVATGISEAGAENGNGFPLVVIIDELDRCRPPFALSVIERIKHMFSVQGVCFVLVTHLPQLEQAIQGAYGANFDAHTYLEKFYHTRITLPEQRDPRQGNRATYINQLWQNLEIQFPNQDHGQRVKADLTVWAELHSLSYRTIERAVTNIAFAAASAGETRLLIPSLVAGLAVIRQTWPDLYGQLKRGEIIWDDFKRNVLGNTEAGHLTSQSIRWWKFVTGGRLTSEEQNEFSQGLARYSVETGEQVMAIMVSHIEDLVTRD